MCKCAVFNDWESNLLILQVYINQSLSLSVFWGDMNGDSLQVAIRTEGRRVRVLMTRATDAMALAVAGDDETEEVAVHVLRSVGYGMGWAVLWLMNRGAGRNCRVDMRSKFLNV